MDHCPRCDLTFEESRCPWCEGPARPATMLKDPEPAPYVESWDAVGLPTDYAPPAWHPSFKYYRKSLLRRRAKIMLDKRTRSVV